MTVGHQQHHSMTAPASAGQGSHLELLGVVQHALIDLLRQALDGSVGEAHSGHSHLSISSVAVSKMLHVASSRRSSSLKCCLNLITAMTALSAFSSVICACLRYSLALAFSVGSRAVPTFWSKALRSVPVAQTTPLRCRSASPTKTPIGCASSTECFLGLAVRSAGRQHAYCFDSGTSSPPNLRADSRRSARSSVSSA